MGNHVKIKLKKKKKVPRDPLRCVKTCFQGAQPGSWGQWWLPSSPWGGETSVSRDSSLEPVPNLSTAVEIAQETWWAGRTGRQWDGRGAGLQERGSRAPRGILPSDSGSEVVSHGTKDNSRCAEARTRRGHPCRHQETQTYPITLFFTFPLWDHRSVDSLTEMQAAAAETSGDKEAVPEIERCGQCMAPRIQERSWQEPRGCRAGICPAGGEGSAQGAQGGPSDGGLALRGRLEDTGLHSHSSLATSPALATAQVAMGPREAGLHGDVCGDMGLSAHVLPPTQSPHDFLVRE